MLHHRPVSGSVAPHLVVDGTFFRLADGMRWHGIQTSEFTLPKRYMAGEEIRPILDERAAIGFNMLRLWLLNESVVGRVYPGGIHPNQHPDFYEKVHALAELCGSYGFVCEFTAFTSCVPLMTNVDDQHRHWEGTQAAVRGLPHVILELVNEYNWGQGQNAPDRSLWSMKPAGILASSGSSTADAPPPEPVWDYVLYHFALSEWQRKAGHNTMEWADVYRKPGGANEGQRYPDSETSTRRAYDAEAGAALLCAFCCFHSQGGKYSRPFDAVERAAAEAWVAGARSVPLEFQAGKYDHREDLEPWNDPTADKTIIRVYERRLPDGRAHIVNIHQ